MSKAKALLLAEQYIKDWEFCMLEPERYYELFWELINKRKRRRKK